MGIGGICSKVVVPISMCDLKGHLYLNNVLLVVNPRIDTKRDWTMCSNIVYHSKCNSQHHFFIFFKFVFFWGGGAQTSTRKSTTCMVWNCQSSHSYILYPMVHLYGVACQKITTMVHQFFSDKVADPFLTS